MNIFKTNNIKIYTETLQNTSLKIINSKEHFPQPPQKECAMKFSPLKKHAPHLKLCILFYRIYRKRPGLILHVCQYSFQNHVKSRKIYI